ncbi:MAG: hypothetical protein AAGA48_05615 [Myxococcota bacterium]
MIGLGWLWLLVPDARACEILAEGAATSTLDCAKATMWAVRCKLPGSKGKRRIRLRVPEWGLSAESRLPLATGERFEVTLLGPNGSRGDFMVKQSPDRLSQRVVSALQLCRPGAEPATLSVSVTEHKTTGTAQQVDANGVIHEVPTYDGGKVVGSAEAKLLPPPPGDDPAAPPPAERVNGKLSVRHGDAWIDLTWTGRKQRVSTETGSVTLLRLDFPRDAVVQALGPGDATALLTNDLVQWLAGDLDSRLGLVAFRRSAIPVPVREIPSFAKAPDSPAGWRGARSATMALSVGPLTDQTVRVALAHRAKPLDEPAQAALEHLWTAPLGD